MSDNEPVSVSERLLEQCFNRKLTDHMYNRSRLTGDELKDWNADRYWELRKPELQAERARVEAEAAKDARIAALEGELRDMREVLKTPEEVLPVCLKLPEVEGDERGRDAAVP